MVLITMGIGLIMKKMALETLFTTMVKDLKAFLKIIFETVKEFYINSMEKYSMVIG